MPQNKSVRTRRDAEQELKCFVVLRNRAARAGHTLHRSVEEAGITYMASCWGVTRCFVRLDQLELFVDLVTGVLDARVAEASA